MTICMRPRISIRASRAWSSVAWIIIFEWNAGELEIELEAGDAVLRAGTF